jgi:hypothetical protein
MPTFWYRFFLFNKGIRRKFGQPTKLLNVFLAMRILLSLLLLCFVKILIAQNPTIQHQSEIIEVYGENWYEMRSQEQGNLLNLMDRYISWGFTVEEIPAVKYQDDIALREIPLVSKNGQTSSIDEFLEEYNSENFNPLKYYFFPQKEEQFYFLKDQNKIIRIKSINYLNSL